jgi:hypothetical protein
MGNLRSQKGLALATYINNNKTADCCFGWKFFPRLFWWISPKGLGSFAILTAIRRASPL